MGKGATACEILVTIFKVVEVQNTCYEPVGTGIAEVVDRTCVHGLTHLLVLGMMGFLYRL